VRRNRTRRERERERKRENWKGEKGEEKGAHGRISGGMEKRTDGNRSRQFMQPLPQVNAASDMLRYADLKALLDSACPPPFSLSRSWTGSLRLPVSRPLPLLRKAWVHLSPSRGVGNIAVDFSRNLKIPPAPLTCYSKKNKGNTFERGASPKFKVIKQDRSDFSSSSFSLLGENCHHR